MIGVIFGPININPDLSRILFLIILIFFMVAVVVWFIRNFIKFLRSGNDNKEKLRILWEFTEQSRRTTSWIKEHKEELKRQPIVVLNNQEFIDLINRDQELYERVLENYPDYPDIVMPPKELRQYFIELAQGQHRQTH